MRKPLLVAAAVSAIALPATAAQAHDTSWYWSTVAAEDYLVEKHADVQAASCSGQGKSIRGKGGRRLFKHFTCGVAFDLDETDGGTLHVTGKWRAVMKWDD